MTDAHREHLEKSTNQLLQIAVELLGDDAKPTQLQTILVALTMKLEELREEIETIGTQLPL